MFIFKLMIKLVILIFIGCSQTIEPLEQDKAHQAFTDDQIENHAQTRTEVDQIFLDDQVVLYAGIDDSRALIDTLSFLTPSLIRLFENLNKFYQGEFKDAMYASQSIRLLLIKKEGITESDADTVDIFSELESHPIFRQYDVIFSLSFEGNQSFFKAIKEGDIVNIYERQRNFYLQKKGNLFVVATHPNPLLKYSNRILALHQLPAPPIDRFKLYLNLKAFHQAMSQLKKRVKAGTQAFPSQIKLLLDHIDDITSLLFVFDIQPNLIKVINEITLEENSKLLSELRLNEELLNINDISALNQPVHFLFYLTRLHDFTALLIDQLNQQRISSAPYQSVLKRLINKNPLLYASKHERILGLDIQDHSSQKQAFKVAQPQIFLDFLEKIKQQKILFAFLLDQSFFQDNVQADAYLSIFSKLKKDHVVSQLDLSVGVLDFLISIKEKDKEHREQIDALVDQAIEFDKKSDFKQTKALFTKAIEIHQQLVTDPDQRLKNQELFLNNQLGLVLVKLEAYADAEMQYRKNLAIGADEDLDEYTMHSNLAWALLLQGKSKEAMIHAKKGMNPKLSAKEWNYHWRKLMMRLCLMMEAKGKINVEALQRLKEFKSLSKSLGSEHEYVLMAKKRLARIVELKENQK